MGVTYTKDGRGLGKFSIGDWSYGVPNVLGAFRAPNDLLTIGKFCSFADCVTIILFADHNVDWATTYPFSALPDWVACAGGRVGHPKTKGKVVIGNDVWIGHGATILSGVIIGDGAVVAAQAVVSKDVLPYHIVAGNPAQVVKTRFPTIIIEKLLELKWWDWPEEKIKQKMDFLCSTLEEFDEKISTE